jgi:hypothetical protein
LTVGTFETVKAGVLLDVSASVFGQFVDGGLSDFTGEGLTVELDVGPVTVEAGQTASGKQILGLELGVTPLIVGGSISGSQTVIPKKASIDLAAALDSVLHSLGIDSQLSGCGCGQEE